MSTSADYAEIRRLIHEREGFRNERNRLQAELEETKLEASKELMLRNEHSDRLQARVDELEKKEPKYLDKPCAHVTPCERKGLCTDER